MNVKKSERLGVVKKLAKRKEQQAAKLLAEFRVALEGEEEQLQGLQAYYEEYVTTITTRRVMTPKEMLAYRHFSKEIADSMNTLQQKIVTMEAHLQKLTRQWQLLHRRRQSFDDLIEESRADELEKLAKDEQKIIDDMVNTRQSYLQDQPR